MKIAVYSPYLDTFGGGERYMLTIAEYFSRNNQVDLLFGSHLTEKFGPNFKQSLANQFNLNLLKVNIKLAPIGEESSSLKRLNFLRSYDVLFYLTDGSIFYSTAKKNILHIQTPILNPKLKSIRNKIKLRSWDLIIYNSQFTKKNAGDFWPIKSLVIYPPVNIEEIKPLRKRNYILSVGRFFGFLKMKKHEVMIKAFSELIKNNNLKDWSLHLVGSIQEGDLEYLEELKRLAKNLPIHFYPNLSFAKLVELYGESSVYWHAMGLSETDPTKMEHFGITVVEAMAGGCIPVVVKKGGLTEIVEEDKSGLFWEKEEELVAKTVALINDSKRMQQLLKNSIIRSKEFSKERFISSINRIVS